MTPITTILCSLIALLIGVAISFLFCKSTETKRQQLFDQQVEQTLQAAEREAKTTRSQILLEAKESALELTATTEQEAARVRHALAEREQKIELSEGKLKHQEASLRKSVRGLDSSRNHLAQQMRATKDQRNRLQQLLQDQQAVLEQASGMSREEARGKLMESLDRELESEQGAVLIRHQKMLDEKIQSQSREILLTAIQRFASTGTAESTTSSVDVPTDDMKGRIIGREGRNIRAFEKATGIDLIIDDTPGVVIVSGFDPVRREVARQALQALIADGRIHPSRIEEIVEETAKKVDSFVIQKGREAAEEVGVHGLHEKVIEMLGRLHFRTSYSQNVLRHSVEVAFLASMVAEMLEMDGELAKRCGLLHDIGKAADHEIEGGHPKIGADFLRRHGEGPDVVHAALGHHDEIVVEHPYTMVTAIGDACSASRPGARRESLDRYVKRMEELESIAKRFDGVDQAYAISAGRELRVIVNSAGTNDEKAAAICRKIAKAFEAELTFPGEIKVTVLREARFIETAK